MKATLLVLSAFVLLYGCATPLTSDMSSPSIAETKTVVFGGKTFVLKFQKPGLWEYFPAEESIDAWNEMVDFTVVPREMNRFKPLDLAKRAIQLDEVMQVIEAAKTEDAIRQAGRAAAAGEWQAEE